MSPPGSVAQAPTSPVLRSTPDVSPPSGLAPMDHDPCGIPRSPDSGVVGGGFGSLGHGAHSLKMLSVFHGMLVVGTDAIRV